MHKPELIDATWVRSILSEPLDIYSVRLQPLRFGTFILLKEFQLLNPMRMGQFTFALYLASRRSYFQAKQSIEFASWGLLWRPFRALTAIKRYLWQLWTHLFLIKQSRRTRALALWNHYIKLSTSIPQTNANDAKFLKKHGFPFWAVIRGVLLESGIYSPDSIMEAPISIVLHDYCWARGLNMESKADKNIEAILKANESESKD